MNYLWDNCCFIYKGTVVADFLIICMQKVEKTIAFFYIFEYTKCNRVARSLLDIGDQAETCAQLFYVKERFYEFEKTFDF